MTWEPTTGSVTITCGCGHDCGERTMVVNEDSYPGTQEIVVEKQMNNGDHQKVIIYLPPEYRVCRIVGGDGNALA